LIFTKKKLALILVIIAATSLLFKLYTVDFSLPVNVDNLGYTLDAIQYSQGDFFIPAKKNPGWPLFISPFMLLVDSDNFIDYSNLVRVLSLSIATFAIWPAYLLGRKFFNEKYSIVVAILFAFEPHLNYNATQGLSEPVFILMFIVSIYFILNQNPRYAILSFLFAGILWWIRLEGVILVLTLTVIYFINFRKSPKMVRNYVFSIIVFLIVVSPMFVQRYNQFGDPLYIHYGGSLFVDEYVEIWAKNIKDEDKSALSYIEEHGIFAFFYKFVLGGLYKVFTGLIRNLYPYLIVLVPIGILFSFRAFDQNKKYIRANWITILITLGIIALPFSVISDNRFLFPLYPFLIIFATIPIQRLTEYGISTFSASQKYKKICLVSIIILVVILSGTFTHGVGKYGFGKVDLEKENEKMQYARFLVNELDGRILAHSQTTNYLSNSQITEDPEIFKSIKAPRDRDPHPDIYTSNTVSELSIYGKTIEELISNGEEHGLKYIAIPGEGAYYFPFLDDVYENEGKYPYLIKVFDSDERGLKKFKVKAFEIDYEKFHEFINEKINT